MDPITTDFTFIETFFSGMISDVSGSATVILAGFLGLLALVVGAFYLVGLAKKGVKQAK